MKKVYIYSTIAIITGMAFLMQSCQEEPDMNLMDNTTKVSEQPLAHFEFENGNSLILLERTIGSQSGIISIESGLNGNEIFIDYKNNSVLDIYLALTPDGYPIPKALMSNATDIEKQRISASRQVINKVTRVEKIKVEKMPGALASARTSDADLLLCVFHPEADYCTDNKHGRKFWIPSGGWDYIEPTEAFVSVFSDSENRVRLWDIYKYSDVGNGSWYKGADVVVPQGSWARTYTIVGAWSKRQVNFASEYGTNSPSIHWKGYVYITLKD